MSGVVGKHMKVILLDDSKDYIQYASNILKTCGHDIEIIDSFHEIQGFIHAVYERSYDIALIGYKLGNSTGLDLIENEMISVPYIIIMTMHNSLSIAKNCFKHHIFRYITKDSFYEELNEALQAIEKEMDQKDIITIIHNGNPYDIDLKTVYAVYSQNHYVYFMNEKQTIAVRESLSEYRRHLLKSGFDFAKSNTLVNLHYVKSIERYKVILTNNKHFLISHNKFKHLQRRYLEVVCRG